MPKCPICDKYKSKKQEIIDHMENEHHTEIPEDMSTAQYLYYKTYGREYGLCRICGKPTPWNEKAGKPSQHCGSPQCKEKIRKIAQERMIKVYGKPSLMNDIKHQEKMLANRKISGTYIWSDRKHRFTYTGNYEKFAIEWLDKVMELEPDRIQMPGPIIPYKFNEETKLWITDIYLEDFNLIIEIKSSREENTHPGFEYNRELEDAKDAAMLKQSEFNYVKITYKTMMNLVKIMAEIRMRNLEADDNKNVEPIITINESIDKESEMNDTYSKLNNSEILKICDDIMNEYTMSIANISPIVKSGTGSIEDAENKNSDLLDRLKNVKDAINRKVKNENSFSEPPEPEDNMFSPNNTKPAKNPFIASDNFIENEEIIVDLETDPYQTKPNDLADITQSNIKSYFN